MNAFGAGPHDCAPPRGGGLRIAWQEAARSLLESELAMALAVFSGADR
ncbi:MAG: hypothetical protein HY748_02555 [Elusimicrobia bacterium]|nr:hypothetical protein [Elusimicrobiota bacterium]